MTVDWAWSAERETRKRMCGFWICSLHRLLGHMQKHNNCAVHNLSARRPCLRYKAQPRQYVYVHQSVAVIGCKPKIILHTNSLVHSASHAQPTDTVRETTEAIQLPLRKSRWSAYYCYRKSSVYGGVHVYASLPVSMIRLLFNKVNFYAL